MTSSQKPLRILIAGAGIAGLATAISLARISKIANLDIQLYEQATELREIGASIALSPNVSFIKAVQRACLCHVLLIDGMQGLRTLEKLGIGEALGDEIGFRGPSGIPQIYRCRIS